MAQMRNTFPLCFLLCFLLDCWCFHGGKSDPAVHVLPVGRSEEQPSCRRTPTDSPAGDEPHACPPGEQRMFTCNRLKQDLYAYAYVTVFFFFLRSQTPFLGTRCSPIMTGPMWLSCVRRQVCCKELLNTTRICTTSNEQWCTHISSILR